MCITVIVGLQAGEDQVERLFLDRGGKSSSCIECIEANERVVFEMNGAIGALGQSLPQDLLGAGGAGGDYDNVSAVFLLLPQRLFQRKGVGLIDFVGNVFANPGAGFVELQRRIFLRHLFHADQNLQANAPRARLNRVLGRDVASNVCTESINQPWANWLV